MSFCIFLKFENMGPLAGLSLVTIVFLQLLVPAKCSNIGATYLWSLYECLHTQMDPKLWGTTQAYYFTQVKLGPEA
jgi:hypothetical protein